MENPQTVWYVLFPNHNEGMMLHKLLRQSGLSSTIAPTPRVLSKCCGISLIVEQEELDKIRQIVENNEIDILEIQGVTKDVDPGRDRYC
ncbi:DUF3343 domain-containing protein [Ruminococcaceae bacterium OttesenSCG-928-I18]|nr:DUF3343 domain-containing protein [Ruminococcaceae bacterium OttesenSCG-928-I18]